MFTSVARAIDQMADPVFLGVVLHSVGWSLLAFVLLAAGVFYGGHALLADQGWLGWLAGVAGVIGTAIASLWLFLPLATVIASLFVERIAAAVERRWYPGLSPARPASLLAQAQDGLILGVRVLAMQIITLVITLIPPHVTGLVIGWVIASWAVGRGLFVPVAMLRMDRPQALLLYRSERTNVLLLGGLMTACGFVPLLNLFAPVLGAAAMVHLMHATRGGRAGGGPTGGGRVVAAQSSVLGHPGQRSVS